MTAASNKAEGAEYRALALRTKRREELSRSLQQLMRETFVTQQEISNFTGIPKDMVSKYVRGENYPSFDTLKTLAKYFRKKPEDLIPSMQVKKAALPKTTYVNTEIAEDNPELSWLQVSVKIDARLAAYIADMIKEDMKKRDVVAAE